jgi:toxin CcdB
MARFSVYELRASGGYVLNLQTDFLDGLETRLVAPLVPMAKSAPPARHLNPILTLPNGQYVLLIQSIAAIRVSALGRVIADVSTERDAITRAVDMVFNGF